MDCIRRIPVIVAAGKGCRMGSDIKKQYLILDSIPVLTRTLQVFDRHDPMDDIILVVAQEDHGWCRKNIVQPYGFTRRIHLVAGGKTRQESVLKGIKKAGLLTDNPAASLVLIHDGVRPFVTADLINHLMDIAMLKGGCIPVLAATDTLKQVTWDNRIQNTLDRGLIYRAQTPQVFRLDLIAKAFEHAEATGFVGTDDASVMEHARFAVHTTPGSDANIKLTTPHDLILARHIIKTRA
jgi:2-C-methyl-D-erythritol 4-phosphate cytidylyltransferase